MSRLLRDARHTEPMPAEVVARMDAVLADLRAEATRSPSATSETEGSRPGLAPVTPIASHRRRRVGALLAAAAAVVVGGVGISHLDLQGDSHSATTADAGSSRADDHSDFGNTGAQKSPTAPSDVPSSGYALPQDARGRVVVHPRRFGADARAVVLAQRGQRLNSAPLEAAGCAPDAPGETVAASYLGAPAVLLLQPPQGHTQVVDLYLCGHSSPTRSVTVPLP